MKRLFLFITAVCSMLAVACENGGDSSKNEVVITSPTEVVLGMYGTKTTIQYEIKGIEDVCADVTISAEWLRISNHKYPGSLEIETETNETGGSRMAAVTLSYKGSSATVVINQSGEATAPIITSLSGDEMNIERAGEKVTIEYSLENRNPDDYVYAKTSADWIYSINTENDGKIELGIATNMSGKARSTVVTIGYGTASFNITINQKGDGDILFKATTLSGEYLGDALSPGVDNYWLVLSDRGYNEDGSAKPNTTYYAFDLYGALYTGNNDMVPIAAGTYTFDMDNTYAQGTFTAEYTRYWVTKPDGTRDDKKIPESGTVVVENGKITADIVINGENHHVEYEGQTTLRDESDSVTIYTTLNGDYQADLSNHEMLYYCEGDYYECGLMNWMFVIIPKNGVGDCFQFDVITEHKNKEGGFCGTYKASDVTAKNVFIYGWTDNIELLCSWFYTADQNNMAALRDGEVTVQDNGDGTYSVNINVQDQLRNTITGSWTGAPQEYVE